MKIYSVCFLISFIVTAVFRFMGYSFWVSLGLAVLSVAIYRLLLDLISKVKEVPGEIKSLRKKFRKYFGLEIDWKWFSKDTSYQSWRDKYSKHQVIIQSRIDEVMPNLAKDFLNACGKEKKLMSPYFKQSKEKVNPKKALKKLKRIQTRISLLNDKFQNAKKAAKEGKFKADYKITEERRIDKEKQEES